jgi:drug/metabolite transporter (DMT)-like permease
MIGYYLALEFTDLSKATTLYWTNPVFTAVIAYFVINESLNFIDWVAIFVSFFGILVMKNPWSLAAMAEERSREETIVDTLGSLAAIGGAICFSVSMMQTRKLGKKVHFLVPPFY